MFKQYEDERYRVQAQGERHETIRFVAGAIAGALVLCSIIFGITYYNVEALKVPVKVSQNTDYNRGN
jgi:hypothetical protein